MKIAVTGATGFIGGYVLAELLERNDIDLVVATGRTKEKPAHIAKGCRYEYLDVAHPHAGDYERIGYPDVLIHLAWSGLPNYYSLHHFESELPKQYAFLSSLLDAGLPSLVVAGTCFEYGMACGELSESFCVSPTNSYGFAKKTLLHQLEYKRASADFDLTWARLFYTYGNGQSANSLYPQLLRAIEKRENNFPLSGGEQLRDFLPIGELAERVVNLALFKKNLGVVNICSGKPISIRSITEAWVVEQNSKIKLDFGVLPYPSYESMAFWGSTRKYDEILAENSKSKNEN